MASTKTKARQQARASVPAKQESREVAQNAGNQKFATMRGLLEQMKPQMEMALPRHLPVERLMRITMTCVQLTPKLLDCERGSFLAAVMTCAQVGLEPDPRLGLIYLVPFKGRVTVIIGYRGYLQLARNSGEIRNIQAQAVHEKDSFSYSFGLRPELSHKPADGDRGEITHFWACCTTKDGGEYFEVMTRAEVERIRDNTEAWKAFQSGSIKSTPWKEHFSEMGRKTAIRRLAKYLPMEVQKAAWIDAGQEGGKYLELTADNEVGLIDLGEEQEPSTAKRSSLDAIEERIAHDPETGELTEETDERDTDAAQVRSQETEAETEEAQPLVYAADPEGTVQAIEARFRACGTEDDLTEAYTRVEPVVDAMFPPDKSRVGQTYRDCAQRLARAAQ